MAKFIFDLPNEQLLPAAFTLVEKVEAFSALFEVERDPVDVIPPVFREEGETDEQFQARQDEAAQRKREATKKYLLEMAKRACLEHPKETAAFSDSFWISEEPGEKLPNAVVTLNEILARDDVLGFFVSLKAFV